MEHEELHAPSLGLYYYRRARDTEIALLIAPYHLTKTL